jgi:hypothetical protein
MKIDSWYKKVTYCKIGTIPMLVQLDKRTTKNIGIGKQIRFREMERKPWTLGVITNITADGFLFITPLYQQRGLK